MKKALIKSAVRDITGSKSRFFSIFGIVMIGVSFFTGLQITSPDMRLSADTYFDDNNLMDFRLVSTFGFDENDVNALDNLEGEKTVYPSYFTDAILKGEVGNTAVRIMSMPADNTLPINSVKLTEGRMPEADNECIIYNSGFHQTSLLGSEITFYNGKDDTDLSDMLRYSTYNVVGCFESALYIDKSSLGSTTVGSGTIGAVFYVPETAFVIDYYTEIYLTFERLKALNTYGEDYDSFIEKKEAELKTISDGRELSRFNDVIKEANEKIADAEKELAEKREEADEEFAKAKRELNDADAELLDAERELNIGKAKLNDGKKELQNGKNELTEGEAELDKAHNEFLHEILDARNTIYDKTLELIDGERQYNDGVSEYNKGLKEYNSNFKTFENGKAEFIAARAEFEAQEAEYLKGKEQFDAAYKAYTDSMTGLDELLAQIMLIEEQVNLLEAANMTLSQQYLEMKYMLEEMQTQYSSGMLQLQVAGAEINAQKDIIESAGTQIEAAKNEFNKKEIEINSAEKQLSEGKAELDKAYATLIETGKTLEYGKKQIAEAEAELDNAEADGKRQFDEKRKDIEEAWIEISDNEKLLSDSETEYEDGLKKYNEGLVDYNDGLKEFEEKKTEAEKKFADAEEEIAKAKRDLAELDNPKWYIFDRSNNPGYSEYGDNADRIRNISRVFPAFFMLVAALVCLTTVQRMVEENRLQVGTLKALGYNNGDIIFKYMLYALLSAALGSVAGILLGMKLFPYVIISAYQMLYDFSVMVMPYDWGLGLVTLAVALLATSVTVLAAAYGELKEQPSQLMRPKSVKKGKRVFLERIPFIWNRFNFSNKVTARNIFRYKRRMLMTVIGISGCTALLLTGFALRDSIGDIVALQFGQIQTYTGMAVLDDKAEDLTSVENIFDENESKHIRVFQKQYDLKVDGKAVSAYIVVAEDSDRLLDFIKLRERVGGNELALNDEGAVLTEKACKLLGIRTGDNINIVKSETVSLPIKIIGNAENYAHNYLYMTEEVYREVFGETPKYNMMYYDNSLSENENTLLSEKLLLEKSVLQISLTSSISKSFEKMLDTLNLVIIVIILAAGGLAFVVMYNLTNINVNERIREIATLKVLGFYDLEVDRYIFKENLILALLGDGVGLILGIFLVRFVVETAEVDMAMFGRDIHAMSFVLAAVLTVAFSCIVTVFMHRYLKKVDMATSLKSVE